MKNYRIKKSWRYGWLSCLICLWIALAMPAMAKPIQGMIAQSPLSAHQLGQQAYEQGQFTQAVNQWQTAMEEFASKNDVRSQALTAGHLAIVYQDLGDWPAAAAALNQASQLATPLNDNFVTAQLLMAQGSQALHQGNVNTALEHWQQAEALYQAIDDEAGTLQSQINQTQALQLLGQHLQASQQLNQLAASIQELPASNLKLTGLQNLGMALYTIGEWQQAEAHLLDSLSLAQQLQLSEAEGSIHLSLGNLFRAQDDIPQALHHYQQVTAFSAQPMSQLTAQLNRLKVLIDQGKFNDAVSSLPTIQRGIQQLPPSRDTIYARVNLANSLIDLSQHVIQDTLGPTFSPQFIAQSLSTAVEQARDLQDLKAEAYALGELGHLYEINQQWSEALDLTRTAASLAQEIQAKEIAMPWQWQQGRILKAQGDAEGAITAYSQAITTLQDLRQELVALSPDVQFSFREQVEPVYRQLVQLLLTEVDSLPYNEQQKRLGRSRQLIEDLQLAILDDFFRQACITGTPRTVDEIDPTAAVIYPIFLNDVNGNQQLEVIVSVPGVDNDVHELIHYGRAISLEESQQLFNTLQATLTPLYRADEILPTAQTLYQWLIKPAEQILAEREVQTLVFVTDGFLRNVPMAVLHDGEQFLLEKYTIALSPGLQLFPSASERLDIATQPQTLASGLFEQRPGFEALPNVKKELEQVQQLTSTETLLNQRFSADNLKVQLQNNTFPILHLATHGQFSSNLEETFLLTWDGRLDIQTLEALLSPQAYRQPIELLILSACQTARGDEQATLGLAGIAVRAGARSTLSTLWSVADASTADFITHFYQNLTQQTTKAEAVRQAQLTLVHSSKYNHPYYWAPFVLVGNWQ